MRISRHNLSRYHDALQRRSVGDTKGTDMVILGDAVAKIVPDAATEFGDSEKFALLTLLSFKRHLVATECVKHMKTAGGCAGHAIYRALQDMNLAMPRPNMPHALTPSGDYRAREIAKLYAREKGIHVTDIRANGTGAYRAVCSCGGLSVTHRMSAAGSSNASMSISRHLNSVEAGTWKNPPPLDQTIDALIGTWRAEKNSGAASATTPATESADV